MVELSRIDSTTETCGTSDQANTKEDKSNISVLLMLYIFGNFATSLAAGIQISNPSCLFWNFSDPVRIKYLLNFIGIIHWRNQ